MGRIFDVTANYFRENNLDFTVSQDNTVLYTRFNCRHVNLRCVARIYEDREIITFCSLLPYSAPPDRLSAMFEHLTRVNHKLLIGNFEMDFTDGQIRYKTSLCAANCKLTSDGIHHLIQFNLETMDRFAPAILTVLFGSPFPNDVSQQFMQISASDNGYLPACNSPLLTPCRHHHERSCTGSYRETSLALPVGNRLACPHRQAARNVAPGEISVKSDGLKPRLLAIMDIDMFAFFDAILKLGNHRCDNVTTFEEAVGKVKNQCSYDLILMLGDKMANPKRMSWLSFVNYIRKSHLKTAILLISHDERVQKEALASGCDAVEDIPFDITVFLENVAGLIGKHCKE